MRYPILILLLSLGFSMLGHAKTSQFDQAYLKWQAQQQAHDARLTAHATAGSSSRPTAHVGGTKININSASVAELQGLHGIGEKKAAAIIEYRQQHGKFQSIQDLQKVKGIGPKLMEKNQDRIGL
jgi:competence protein ComEA